MILFLELTHLVLEILFIDLECLSFDFGSEQLSLKCLQLVSEFLPGLSDLLFELPLPVHQAVDEPLSHAAHQVQYVHQALLPAR